MEGVGALDERAVAAHYRVHASHDSLCARAERGGRVEDTVANPAVWLGDAGQCAPGRRDSGNPEPREVWRGDIGSVCLVPHLASDGAGVSVESPLGSGPACQPRKLNDGFQS